MLRFLVLFFYLFPISFVFIPMGLTTRMIITVCGLLMLIIHIVRTKKIDFNQDIIRLFYYFIGFIAISFLSMSLNSSTDIQFVFYPVSLLLILISSYAVVKLFKFDSRIIIITFVYAIVAQNILSLLMFVMPELSQFLNDYQNISELDLLKLDELSEMRLLGFGSSYFGSGIINCVGLLFIAYLYLEEKITSRKLMYVLLFLVTAFIGILKARTTFLGVILALLYISTRDGLKSIKFLIQFLFISLFIGFLVFSILEKFVPNFDVLMSFGFEMFENYFRYGSLESNSTDELTEMYTLPNDVNTWIIGDGHWNSLTKGDFTYYKNTDVGYLRMIYYFGLIGTFYYFLFHLNFFKIISSKMNNINFKYLLVFSGILLVVLNFKGFADLFFVFSLFLFSKPYEENQSLTYSR